MQRRVPAGIRDYLSPTPSHLLTTTLADLVPTLSAPSGSSSTVPLALPQGHHLVYHPIQKPPSQLWPDGADPDHSPGPPFSRRLWAGGELSFRPGWARRLLLDGRAWCCREELGEVEVKGIGTRQKVFVPVWRRYRLGHDTVAAPDEDWDIVERRTLVFVPEPETPPPAPRLITCTPPVFYPPLLCTVKLEELAHMENP